MANMHVEDRAGLTSMTIQSQKENLMEMRYIKMMQFEPMQVVWTCCFISLSFTHARLCGH